MLLFRKDNIYMKLYLLSCRDFNTFYGYCHISSWTQVESKFYSAMLMALLDCSRLNRKPMRVVLLVKLFIV